MLGSDVLDVAIGIVLLFLFVSLICSALREAVETVLKSRASDLERGIRELLQDKDGTALAKTFYDHPLVYALYAGDYDPAELGPARFLPGTADRRVMSVEARGRLPTYIPSETFAAALIDLIRSGAKPGDPLSLKAWEDTAAKIGNAEFQRAVTAILKEAGDDAGRIRKGFESWYDATMDRVSGWYKRRTQIILLATGLATAMVFNIDALSVARHLATDKSYRQAVVAVAESLPQDTIAGTPNGADGASPSLDSTRRRVEAVRTELDQAGFLMGWPATQVAHCWAAEPDPKAVAPATAMPIGMQAAVPCFWAWPQMLFEWIVTALGVSLGAPFWFDLLNKFMVVRSTVKPAEKSGREASKDSQAAGKT